MRCRQPSSFSAADRPSRSDRHILFWPDSGPPAGDEVARELVGCEDEEEEDPDGNDESAGPRVAPMAASVAPGTDDAIVRVAPFGRGTWLKFKHGQE